MDYQALYLQKKTTPDQIAGMIRDGQKIYTDITLAQPDALFQAIGRRMNTSGLGTLEDIEMHTVLDVYPIPWYEHPLPDKMHAVSWFHGNSARGAVNRGMADILPGYYRDFPEIVRQTQQVDVFLAAVSPMDRHGYFSLSTVGSISEALIEKTDYICLEVNEQLPRSLSAPVIHISQVKALCENSHALPVLPKTVPDAVSMKIGQQIAEEIPDGATIQLGIGAIPDAVGLALMDKKHLGIHTEMFTDSMVALIEAGAVDNSRKPIHRGRSVATFAFGSQRIYDYIDDNRAIEILPADYVNQPAVIAQHPDFMSVNAALSVDFFGQVASEALGNRQISGTGGQVDYVRGAVLSKGGKSFIAFPSTANHGKLSRIVPFLEPGTIVTTSKNDVDMVVTEYGIARLRGRTVSQRTKNLIQIAHPAFRDELTHEAKKRNIII